MLQCPRRIDFFSSYGIHQIGIFGGGSTEYCTFFLFFFKECFVRVPKIDLEVKEVMIIDTKDKVF